MRLCYALVLGNFDVYSPKAAFCWELQTLLWLKLDKPLCRRALIVTEASARATSYNVEFLVMAS